MSISKILPGDTLGSGFRVKYNDTVDKLITGGSLLSSLSLRLNLYDGTNLSIPLSNFIYSKAQVNALIASPLQPPTDINCSTNPLYPYSNAGTTLYVTAAGKIGGEDGKSVQIGDLIICKENMTPIGEVDGPQTEAQCGTKWFVVEGNKDYATETIAGLIQIATQAEVTTGTNATKSVTPATLKAVTDTLVTLGTAQNITATKTFTVIQNLNAGANVGNNYSVKSGLITYANNAGVTQTDRPAFIVDDSGSNRSYAFMNGSTLRFLIDANDISNIAFQTFSGNMILAVPTGGFVLLQREARVGTSSGNSLKIAQNYTFRGASNYAIWHNQSTRLALISSPQDGGTIAHLIGSDTTDAVGNFNANNTYYRIERNNVNFLDITYGGRFKTKNATDTGEDHIFGGSARVNGNLIVDTDTFFINASTNNIGMGTVSPAFANGSGLEIEKAGITTIRLQNTTGGNAFELYVDSAANGVYFYGANASDFVFSPGGSRRGLLRNNGNLIIGPSGTSDTGEIGQFAGTLKATKYVLKETGFAHGVTNKLATDEIMNIVRYSSNGGTYFPSVSKVATESAFYMNAIFVTAPNANVPGYNYDVGQKSGTGVVAIANDRRIHSWKNAGVEKAYILGDGRMGGANPTDDDHFVTKSFLETNFVSNQYLLSFNNELSAGFKKYFVDADEDLIEIPLGNIPTDTGLMIDFHVRNLNARNARFGVEITDGITSEIVIEGSGYTTAVTNKFSLMIDLSGSNQFVHTGEHIRSDLGTAAQVYVHDNVFSSAVTPNTVLKLFYVSDDGGETIGDFSIPYIKIRKA